MLVLLGLQGLLHVDDRRPEDVIVSNAEVTTGLGKLGTLVGEAAAQASGAAATAKSTVNQSWNQWLAIEGRIKKNDTEAYLEFEDALSDMRIGADDKDAAKVKKGSTAVAALIAAYLAKFPDESRAGVTR